MLRVGDFRAVNRGKVTIDGSTYQINPTIVPLVSIPKGVEASAIRISLDKTPEAMIADIKRRFWGAYLAELEAMRAAVKAYETRTNAIQARAHQLGAIIGARVDAQAGQSVALSLYHSRELAESLGEFVISGDEVRIERLYVSDEVAAEILRVMVRARKAHPKAAE